MAGKILPNVLLIALSHGLVKFSNNSLAIFLIYPVQEVCCTLITRIPLVAWGSLPMRRDKMSN